GVNWAAASVADASAPRRPALPECIDASTAPSASIDLTDFTTSRIRSIVPLATSFTESTNGVKSSGAGGPSAIRWTGGLNTRISTAQVNTRATAADAPHRQAT